MRGGEGFFPGEILFEKKTRATRKAISFQIKRSLIKGKESWCTSKG